MISESSSVESRKRVLLVEDDAAVRRSLQLLFAAHGYDVRAYRSSDGLAADPEALQAACLVADMVLPGPDGLKLLQQLRGAGWTGRAMLISGHLQNGTHEVAQAAGFDVVLAKPILSGQLLSELHRLIGSAA